MNTATLPTTAPLTPSAPPFDPDAYKARFSSVIDAYRAGTADAELPADDDAARSIIPPGTAASRDFSALSAMIPVFDPEACVGCMACVSSCPDSALMATVQARSTLEASLAGPGTPQEPQSPRTGPAPGAISVEGSRIVLSPRGTFEAQAGPLEPTAAPAPQWAQDAVSTLRSHFAATTKYYDLPARSGAEPGLFGIFVDPARCKGCGECVEVCSALGHHALAMLAKSAPAMVEPVAIEPVPLSNLDQAQAGLAFLHGLPHTSPQYRNPKVEADLMLNPAAFGSYTGGAGSCSGCGEATAIRMAIAATIDAYGPQSLGIVAATGCNSVFGATYPYNPYNVPWTNSLFENAPADALGIRMRWDQSGHADRRLWVFGGDGAMYDIGFGSLSRMVASGSDIKVLVLDTGAYSNTGGQASTASFGAQVAKLAAFGKSEHGKRERRKELGRILMAHGEVYVAQVSTAYPAHFYRAVAEANSFEGPAVVIAYAPCMPENGIADDEGNAHAKTAVESRAWPLFTYDPRRGATMRERLSLTGNPAVREDWPKAPDGRPLDFIGFARTEGRFRAHFDREGNPSAEIVASAADRLANWHSLREMAGLMPAPVGPASA